MNIKRYLQGNVSFHYEPYMPWLSGGIDKYWGGRLIYFNAGKFSLLLDCRVNVFKDLFTGKIY